MKTVLILIFTVLVLGTLYSIPKPYPSIDKSEPEGIQFYQGTWENALLQAQKENKEIFLDVYATWCGPCKKLKRKTFTDKKVGAYFNNRFINIAINGETEEGKYLADRYGLFGYPSLLVITPEGKVTGQTSGYHSPKELLLFANSVHQPQTKQPSTAPVSQ